MKKRQMREKGVREHKREKERGRGRKRSIYIFLCIFLELYTYILYLTWWEINTLDSPSLKTETQCTHGLI